MLLPDERIKKLVDLSDEQLESLLEKQKESGKSLQSLVLENNILSERALTEKYAEAIGVPFVVIDRRDVTSEALGKIPEPVARQYKAVVFNVDAESGRIDLAIDDPEDIQAINF